MSEKKTDKKGICKLFAGMQNVAFICDYEGRIVYLNDSIKKKLGFSDNEISRACLSELYSDSQKQEAEKVLSQILDKKDNVFLPPIKTKSGKKASVEIRVYSFEWSGKQCVFGVFEDLDEERRLLQKFRKLFVNIPSPMIICELSTQKITDANLIFLKKLQYKKSNVIGKKPADIGLAVNLEREKYFIEKLKEKGRVRNVEMKIRASNGKKLDTIVSGEVFESQGRKLFLTIIVDVTEQKQTEKQIRESLSRQKMLADISIKLNRYKSFKRMMNGILKKIGLHIQADHLYIFEKDAPEKTYSKTHEWHAREKGAKTDDMKKIPAIEIPFLGVLAKKGVYKPKLSAQWPGNTANNSQRENMKTLVLPLEINKNQFGFIGFDRTAEEGGWKQAEVILLKTIASSISSVYEKERNLQEIKSKKEEIDREKKKIETIIQSIGDGVFVVDKKLRIILFNQVASKLSGYSEEEALNEKFYKILRFVPEANPKKENSDFIKQAIATGEKQAMPRRTLLVSKSGKRVPVADSVVPLRNALGKIVGCVVVFRDATREREIDRMKSEFVSMASHQLKTPMTGIKWMSELILREDLDKKQKEYMRDIHDSSDRLVTLIDDLLNLSHIETGRKFEIGKKNIEFSKIIKELIENNKDLAQQRGVEIMLSGNLSKTMISVDRDKIKHALGNILDNAIKYSRSKDGKVLIDYKKKNGNLIVKIKDNGIGIPVSQQKRLFERFFRADNATQLSSGTGLGLTISKAIIEEHNGRVWFESKKNSGTVFYVELPFNNT